MPAYYRYEVEAGNGAAGWVTTTFAIIPISAMLDITVWDNRLNIQLSYDGVNFGETIEIDNSDPPVQFPFAARAFRVQNTTAALVARYQVIGMI